MIDSLFLRDHVRRRLRSGPAGPYLSGFARALEQERYRQGTICRYVRAADGFGRWLGRGDVAIAQVTDAVAGRYLAELGRLQCPARPGGRLPDIVFGTRKFVEWLRQQGVVSQTRDACASSPADRWLVPFALHLERRGLTAGTRRIYLRYAGLFVDELFGTGAPDGGSVAADRAATFVRKQAARLRSSSSGAPVTAIRAFLRYLVVAGIVDAPIDAAVPTIRQWKLASLPKYLSDDDVRRVLATCDTTPVGRRDRAILSLLVRLGLRAGEVVGLRLDDFDWREGCIRIRPGKTGRERVLPLPEDLAADGVAYLREGRPASADRAVFLTASPPYRALKNSSCVSSIARAHLIRAGITSRPRGAHRFRHTAATQMVRRGVAFKQVADILGHQKLQTTAIYAKLDLPGLASLCMPFPGGDQ